MESFDARLGHGRVGLGGDHHDTAAGRGPRRPGESLAPALGPVSLTDREQSRGGRNDDHTITNREPGPTHQTGRFVVDGPDDLPGLRIDPTHRCRGRPTGIGSGFDDSAITHAHPVGELSSSSVQRTRPLAGSKATNSGRSVAISTADAGGPAPADPEPPPILADSPSPTRDHLPIRPRRHRMPLPSRQRPAQQRLLERRSTSRTLPLSTRVSDVWRYETTAMFGPGQSSASSRTTGARTDEYGNRSGVTFRISRPCMTAGAAAGPAQCPPCRASGRTSMTAR